MGEGLTGPTDQPPGRRLTVTQAAAKLGISDDAVRSRIKRGTLETEREGGRVFVVLSATARSQPTDRPGATDQPDDRTDLLIAELQDRVRSLEEANRENRRIIAGMVQRVPAIEASPEAATAGPESQEPATKEAQEAQEAAEPPRDRSYRLQQELLETRQRLEDERSRPRSWWRRWFGG